ncbi:uncharacterized protein LOC135398060 [Ornithodoros turicata]|uniref:uncharacterized protein LOC135398060 n=1 Tax=Ornithodoros turicata TaxID=34597 RepID=UPI0031391DFA
MAQVMPPVEDPAVAEALPDLIQFGFHDRKESQVTLDGDSEDDAAIVTLDDGSVWKPYWQPSHEAIRASGEHALDLKERVTTPRSIREDVGSPDSLDVDHLAIDPSFASEKTEPVGEVGDFQHDAPRSEKPSRDLASLVSDVHPAVPPVSEVILPPPHLQVQKTQNIFDDKPERTSSPLNMHGLQHSAADFTRRLIFLERSHSSDSDTTHKNCLSEQTGGLSTIPEVSERDFKNSLGTSKLSMADKSSSTTSLSASPKSSMSGMGSGHTPVTHELRFLSNCATQTDLSDVDASTSTDLRSDTKIPFHKLLVMIMSTTMTCVTCVYLFYVLALYLKALYESGFKQYLGPL